jgi:hypothetical protein
LELSGLAPVRRLPAQPMHHHRVAFLFHAGQQRPDPMVRDAILSAACR